MQMDLESSQNLSSTSVDPDVIEKQEYPVAYLLLNYTNYLLMAVGALGMIGNLLLFLTAKHMVKINKEAGRI